MFSQWVGHLSMIDELPSDLHDLYRSLLRNWSAHLEVHGLKLPTGRGKLLCLLCLYANIGRPVSQTEMIDWIAKKGGHYNRQARHLGGADGWNISTGNSRATLLPFDKNLKRNELILNSVQEPNPIWLQLRSQKSKDNKTPKYPLNILKKRLKKHWKSNLQPFGVKFPTGDGKLLPLLALYANLDTPMSQIEISKWVSRYNGSYNKQARHLAGVDGWYLISGNKRSTLMEYDTSMSRDQLKLRSVSEANPIWIAHHRLTRIYNLSRGDWGDILDAFSERGCSVCGRHFEHYDKGHLNPELPLTPDNVVPMCTECNNWAGSKNCSFSLDKRNLIARPRVE
jgi:hypothetical protein